MAAPSPKATAFVAAPREDVCLDFVNTRYWRGRDAPTEGLHGIDDLLAWTAGTGGMGTATAEAFSNWWRARPCEASAAFASAIALRETLFRLFAAVASHEATKPGDLDALNAALSLAAPRSRMALRDDGLFVWSADMQRPGVAALLSPVLWSASDLLAGARRERVRQCANPQCRWVFLDDSKSGNRRWCSMAACGNRAKAHRHYLKRRDAALQGEA